MNSITINSVEIPLEKVCVFCNGELECQEAGEPPELCGKCKNGKQPIYYTPQQIEELTGEKWKGNIWIRDIKGQPFEIYEYLDLLSGDTAVCAIKNQPAPPADYRVVD